MGKDETLGAALVGGAIIAFWLYGLIFGYGTEMDWASWMGWGIVGLCIGAAVYGIRFARDAYRVILVAAVGAILVMLILGAVLEEEPHLWAAFITGLGSSVLVAALPLPRATPTVDRQPA